MLKVKTSTSIGKQCFSAYKGVDFRSGLLVSVRIFWDGPLVFGVFNRFFYVYLV